MKAEFSFRYGEKQYKLAAMNGAVYEVDDGIAVKVTGKAYEGYDAVEWVLSFENTSNQDSGIFSDILGFVLTGSNGGVFNLGYTLQAAMTGFIYGICLYKSKISFSKVFATA